ncbi:MAG: BtrH N-terminal domain-containing protein [Candidatus Promineifilaceae bacterium]
MPTIPNYNAFNGRHWETGSVHNHYAARGVTAPHTGKPYSEAFLLGISGGIVMGYFVFTYEGYDPQSRILTRNTFDPMDTMLERLGVIQDLQHTAKPENAVSNLVNALEEGIAPIVWADVFSLPYNTLGFDDEQLWLMYPIVVYGYDKAADIVYIADRAAVPLTVTTAELAKARGKIKKFKHRLLILDPPNPDKLVSAVQMSIWACIKLFTEKPPKGSKNNFGFAAYRHWAEMLVKAKGRRTWAAEFPPGSALYAGLTSSFFDISAFGKDGTADRDNYADFLDEAAVLLGKPALKEVAQKFRASTKAWEAVSLALLPDHVEPFQQTRALMVKQHHLFIENGQASLDEIRQINRQLKELKRAVSADFPLDQSEVQQLKENLADKILTVHDIEYEAIMMLQEAMG